MQSEIQESDANDKISKESSNEAKQFFINDEKFKLLKMLQREIFEATEISPSIRKIVNDLINEENLQKVKTKFINVWNN